MLVPPTPLSFDLISPVLYEGDTSRIVLFQSMSPPGSSEYRVICMSCADDSKGSMSVLSFVSSSSMYSYLGAGERVVGGDNLLVGNGRCV